MTKSDFVLIRGLERAKGWALVQFDRTGGSWFWAEVLDLVLRLEESLYPDYEEG